MPQKLMPNDRAASQTLDSAGIVANNDLGRYWPDNAACSEGIDAAATRMKDGGAIICRTQPARTFGDMAAKLGVDGPAGIDLRDRAGPLGGVHPCVAVHRTRSLGGIDRGSPRHIRPAQSKRGSK